MNTDARRRATAAFVEKRKAEGWKKMTFWVSPAAQKYLEMLKVTHGTLDKVLEAAIRLEKPLPDEDVGKTMRRITERIRTAEMESASPMFGPILAKPGARLKKR